MDYLSTVYDEFQTHYIHGYYLDSEVVDLVISFIS